MASDDVAGVRLMQSREMQDLSAPRVILPRVIAAGTRRILDAFKELDRCDYTCSIIPCEVSCPRPLPEPVAHLS